MFKMKTETSLFLLFRFNDWEAAIFVNIANGRIRMFKLWGWMFQSSFEGWEI